LNLDSKISENSRSTLALTSSIISCSLSFFYTSMSNALAN
jgi:hypothetical protein